MNEGILRKLDPRRMDRRGRVLLGVLVIALVAGGYYAVTVRSDSRVSRALANMPAGSVELINDAGETITLNVKIAETAGDRSTGFKNSGSLTVENTVIFMRYTINTIAGHTMENVRAPLDIAFFNENGDLIEVVQTELNTGERYSPADRVRYRYAIMAHRGFMNEMGISVEGEARLLPDTLSREV